MKIYCRIVVLFCLLMLFSSHAMAQTTVQACPTGKVCTVFMLVNGILVGDQKVNGTVVKKGKDVWSDDVLAIGKQFFSYNRDLDQNYVKFIPVYNTSEGLWKDLRQSGGQWSQQEIDAVSAGIESMLSRVGLADKLLAALRKYNSNLQFSDNDLVNLVETIAIWSVKGYTVVLVGHSQGTFYTNMAYEIIRDGKITVPSIPSLPNSLKLEIVNIASAAGPVVDGRGKYTTQCGDPLPLYVPGSLPANVNNAHFRCVGPIVSISPQYDWRIHALKESYLADGSDAQKQIYRQLEESLAVAPPPPSPIMTITPLVSNVSVMQKSAASVSVDVVAKNSANVAGKGTAELYCKTNPCPLGITASRPATFSLPANGSVNFHLTFTTSAATPAGEHTFAYILTLGGKTVSATIALTVTPPPTPSIAFNPSVQSKPVLKGQSVTFNTTFKGTNTPSGKVYFSMTCYAGPCPVDFGYNYTYANVAIAANGSISTFATYNVGTKAIPGTYIFDHKAEMANLPAVTTRYIVTVTAPVTTGTVSITSNVATTCTLSGVSVNVPTTLSNQQAGNKTLSCSAPTGYTVSSISPSSANLAAGKTVSFDVVLKAVPLLPFSVTCSYANSPVTLGQSVQVTMVPTNGVAPVAYIANGTRLGINTSMTITPNSTGTSSVSVNATDNAGRKASSSCSAQVVAPVSKPVLNNVKVNVTVKAGKKFSAILNGSGFVKNSQGYVCSSTNANSCSSFSTDYVSASQLTMSVTWNSAGTIYFKVMNPSNVPSGLVSLVVNK